MRYFILTVVFLFLFANILNSQDTIVDHWETVIFPEDSLKYFPGTTDPGHDWKNLTFDDAAWQKGIGGVGYGDGDDGTEISHVLSVFIRKEFTIVDISKVSQAVLHVDYDDAFVAYLNGTEIAGANIGVPGDSPAYDQPAAGNHEANMYKGGLPDAFLISNEQISSLLLQGNNVLSVQVHNVEITSSDMSSIIFLSLGINDTSSDYRPTPGWFTPPPPAAGSFTSSNLPIIVINTEGGVGIPDEPKITADMGIIYNNGARNYLTDPFNEYSGKIGIETRGNKTQTFPKKAYGLETRDNLGENRNVSLFGLPEENDWILRACYIDKTLMRNSLASIMSHRLGRYAPRTIFCELAINGSYEGVYVFIESIKRDKNRVNIDKLYPGTTSADSLTGGYIYEVSQSGVEFGLRRRYKYPDADDINVDQANYIRNYDDNFRSTMAGANYADPIAGYPKYIDVNSFIDEIIVQEATKNSDAYGWSSYFHKDRLRKLCAGPIWDFDQALTNSTFNDGARIDEWVINKGLEDVPSFWPKLFGESKFKYLLKKRWFELRENEVHTDSIMSIIDSIANYLDEAQQRNFVRWPILGVELWRSLPGWDERDTYQKEVDYMKNWLADHMDWMDIQLASVPDQVIEIPELVISEIMYSPQGGSDYDFIEIANTGDSDIELTGVFFANGFTFTFPNGEIISKGGFKVIAADSQKFQLRYGFAPAGEFYGQLDKAGERITLQNSLCCDINSVRYNDKAPWPVIDALHPGSIELVDLLSDNSLPENWAISTKPQGTPMTGYGQTGTEFLLTSSEITIFPNPISENMNIRFSDIITDNVKIEIYNLLGKLQLSEQYNNFTGQYITLNLYYISNGHYIVKLTTNKTTFSKLIIISR